MHAHCTMHMHKYGRRNEDCAQTANINVYLNSLYAVCVFVCAFGARARKNEIINRRHFKMLTRKFLLKRFHVIFTALCVCDVLFSLRPMPWQSDDNSIGCALEDLQYT